MNDLLDSEEFLVCVAQQAYNDSNCAALKRVDSKSTAIDVERHIRGGFNPFDSKTTMVANSAGVVVGYGRSSAQEKVMVFSVPSMRLELAGRRILEEPLEELPRLLTHVRNSDRWIAKARLELGV